MSDRPFAFVRSAVRLDEVASTNDLAKAEAATTPPDALPRLYRADRQTRGRGRGSNAWFSDAGSLLVSILLDPGAHALAPGRPVSLAVGLALLRTVEPHVPATCRLGLRWPNDVEADDRKLAGILVEDLTTPGGSRLVIGIGLNVTTRFDHAPDDVRRLAASLAEFDPALAGAEPLDAALHRLLVHLERELGRLAAADPGQAEDWDRADLLRGRPIVLQRGDQQLRGTGCGIAEDGSLLLSREGSDRPVRVRSGRVLR